LFLNADAMKQFHACDYNPFVAVKTNFLGAHNVIDAAIDCGVQRVIALSTDKAVSPVNLYGATKLCAEKLFIQGNSYAGVRPTRFSCVRYGNVLGSRGSVVPVFLRQRSSGTVTVTDPRMTRFWITLEQAVEFVVRCAAISQGGEVFVPRIPSLSISDLVRAIAPGCKMKISGIRPGEKLHEVLVSMDEARHTVRLPGMFVVVPEHQWWAGEPWPDGEPLPDGFCYSSDQNDDWLTVEALRELLGVKEDGHAAPALQRAAA
jgi:UDP-N-acetylglucosamine 4,6-dehydratase